MSDLLTQLNKWRVVPPPPADMDNGDGWNNGKWNDAIFNQLENLIWMIEEKHWQDHIYITRDLVDRLRNIPETYIRSIMDALMADDDNGKYKKYIRGS